MERLIAEGVSADAKDGEFGSPALVKAAQGGHLDALKLLRRHGANLDAKDWTGSTALMGAARYGHAAVAAQLVEAGADATLRATGGPHEGKGIYEGKTALEIAEAKGEAEVAALLEGLAEALA